MVNVGISEIVSLMIGFFVLFLIVEALYDVEVSGEIQQLMMQ